MEEAAFALQTGTLARCRDAAGALARDAKWRNHDRSGHSQGRVSLVEEAEPGRHRRLHLIERGEGRHGPKRPAPALVRFSRQELTVILTVYGRKVARGEWRDYAVDMLRDRALFSIFRRASEVPKFVIEKEPGMRNRQGLYRVTDGQGRVLRRGHELDKVLRIIDHELVVIK